MKIRKLWRALLAALLCAAALCPALAAAEDALNLEDNAAFANDAAEDAIDLEMDDEFDGAIAGLPDLDLSAELDTDGGISADAQPEAIALDGGVQSNDEAEPASEDAVPLVATYSGGTLSKVYDCNRYGAYSRKKDDGTTEIVYIIEALKTIKGQFTLSPAKGYDWVEDHEEVTFQLSISKQFDAADVGKYTFEFTLRLTGDNASLYKLDNPVVAVPARITQREVVVTPRAGLSKVYGAKDPAFPEGTWLSSDETSPLHQDVSGVPGYGIPMNRVDDKMKLTVDDGLNGAYLLQEAKLKGTKFFPNDGFLSRKSGEKPGKYRITKGNLDFGSNFKIKLAKEYFTILPRDISDSTVTVKDIGNKTYTGKAIKPAPVVRFNGKKLKSGTHYTLKYSGNKGPGSAYVTITGKGNFTGTRKLTFKIVLKPTAISKLKAGKGQITVTWKKGSQNNGYQLSYSLSDDFFGETTKTVKGIGKTSLTLKKLQSKATYYVRIRTYKTVKGTTYYSAWSKAKKIRVK